MIARGFKPVGWVAAVGAAALGCYMLSLRVAAERADLTSLEQRIVETRQQIRALQTELGTRGRLQQLEQWNDDVLALAAPASSQFLASEAQLARFATAPVQPLDQAGEVRMAAAPVAPPPVAPAVQHAVATPQRAIAPPPALQQPLVQRASLSVPQPAARAPQRAAPTRTATATPRPAPTPRRAALLDERTLRDIGSAARAERRGGTGD